MEENFKENLNHILKMPSSDSGTMDPECQKEWKGVEKMTKK